MTTTQEIDPRIRNLSYSSNLNLHSCPRKFQLDKLGATGEDDDFSSSVTFAFGHAVGLGIQLALQDKTEEQIFWSLFMQWEPDLFARNDKQAKSFWEAMSAMQTFFHLQRNGFLEDWELVYYDGQPAVELSFCINLPNGFRYRGYVDAVLRHKINGTVRVLECKTTAARALNPATYKNSAQAIGYSIVLDQLFPDLSSYDVLYLVYQTTSLRYETLEFTKSYLQRALWIQELLLDVDVISMYEERGVYPMRGENCVQYMRDCKYLQTCTLNTAYLTSALSEEALALMQEKESKYQINVSIHDLIAAQLAKDT